MNSSLQLATAFTGFFYCIIGMVHGEQAKAAKMKAVEDALDAVEKLLKDDYFDGLVPMYLGHSVFDCEWKYI